MTAAAATSTTVEAALRAWTTEAERESHVLLEGMFTMANPKSVDEAVRECIGVAESGTDVERREASLFVLWQMLECRRASGLWESHVESGTKSRVKGLFREALRGEGGWSPCGLRNAAALLEHLLRRSRGGREEWGYLLREVVESVGAHGHAGVWFAGAVVSSCASLEEADLLLADLGGATAVAREILGVARDTASAMAAVHLLVSVTRFTRAAVGQDIETAVRAMIEVLRCGTTRECTSVCGEVSSLCRFSCREFLRAFQSQCLDPRVREGLPAANRWFLLSTAPALADALQAEGSPGLGGEFCKDVLPRMLALEDMLVWNPEESDSSIANSSYNIIEAIESVMQTSRRAGISLSEGLLDAFQGTSTSGEWQTRLSGLIGCRCALFEARELAGRASGLASSVELLLADSHPLVRASALSSLWHLLHMPDIHFSDRVPSLLVNALGDDSADVRSRAASVLRQVSTKCTMDGRHVVYCLAEVVFSDDTGPDHRVSAVTILGKHVSQSLLEDMRSTLFLSTKFYLQECIRCNCRSTVRSTGRSLCGAFLKCLCVLMRSSGPDAFAAELGDWAVMLRSLIDDIGVSVEATQALSSAMNSFGVEIFQPHYQWLVPSMVKTLEENFLPRVGSLGILAQTEKMRSELSLLSILLETGPLADVEDAWKLVTRYIVWPFGEEIRNLSANIILGLVSRARELCRNDEHVTLVDRCRDTIPALVAGIQMESVVQTISQRMSLARDLCKTVAELDIHVQGTKLGGREVNEINEVTTSVCHACLAHCNLEDDIGSDAGEAAHEATQAEGQEPPDEELERQSCRDILRCWKEIMNML